MRISSISRTAWLEETHSIGFELRRHFFRSFFDSDFVSTPGQWKVVAAGAIGLVASLAVLMIPAYYAKYRALLELDTPDPYNLAALSDHLFFVALSMVLTGLLTAFQWPSLFPGLRDYLALASLPIRPRNIFIAKLAALILFVGVYILAVNLLPSIGLPAVMAGRYQPNGLARFLGLLVTTNLAGLFVFFSLIALQGVLLNLLPPALFSRVSLFVQGTLFVVLIGAMPFVLTVPGLPMGRLPQWLLNSPLFWFVGASQSFLATGIPLPPEFAQRALIATAFAMVTALAAYLWSYRRHRVRVLESQAPSESGAGILGRLYSWLTEKTMPDPSEHGIFFFIGATLGRSRQHRMVLTIFIAAAGAIVIQGFLSVLLGRGSDAWVLRSFALRHAAVAAPLALSLFGLAGLRYLFRLPVELRANWLFRIDEGAAQTKYQDAVDRFMRWWGVFPVAIATLPLEISVFGVLAGLGATAICLLTALILEEVLLMQFPRVPFTSAYFPGKRPVAQTVLMYGLWVTLYVSILGAITVQCLTEPNYFLIEFGILLALWAKVRKGRREAMQLARIEFEDLPEPDVRTLSIERD